jgi:transcriptional regulator with XRE-family HTH domain
MPHLVVYESFTKCNLFVYICRTTREIMEQKVTIPEVQIGSRVQEVFESRNMKLSDLADQLGTVRQNVYRIFKKKDLDTGLLIKISEVLDHNFFHYYKTPEPSVDHPLDKELSDARSQMELARKEIDYLKKIIVLMEEKARLMQAVEVR